MGRVKKNEDTEEAKKAQKEQIKKSNQKYQAKRRKFRTEASPDQLTLIKLLNENVISDKDWVTEKLKEVQERLPKEPEPKEKVDASKVVAAEIV